MPEETREVTRSVDVDAAPDAVWEVLVDPDRRDAWLDDDDSRDRELRIDHADTGSTLTWTWWHNDDPAGASRVEVVLTELDTGGTRVAVTERRLTPSFTARASVSASASRTWDRRLLGLELLLLTAGLCVG
ncbi:MAG TPA: hypothetical protein VGJ86_15650 [Acidimicrobiales bacterium]|jgi:uncharacterized protein YndB with AHSA1/START domain